MRLPDRHLSAAEWRNVPGRQGLGKRKARSLAVGYLGGKIGH